MSKNSLIEYPAYLLIRFLGIIVVSLPLRINFILGKSIGSALYYLLKKKRRLVLKNLKIAFSNKKNYEELEKIAKGAFESLALSIIETLYIPRINSRYINKHIRIENLNYLEDGLKMKKGVILLAFHLGNWELANITCGLQGYNYKVVVNEQRYPLLNKLLNRYRESKGCRTISRGASLRQILGALKNNEVVAMVGDQGGREGRLSNFFGIPTSMPVGFIRFALNTEAVIIPAIIIRERKFYHRIIIESPLKIEGEENKKVIENSLSQTNRILENYIEKYPQEYFWFYKIWKYSPFKSVVVLSDGKAGHLRQAQAVSKVISGFDFQSSNRVMEIKFKNKFTRLLAGILMPQELEHWRFFLTKESYHTIRNVYADFVISCGIRLAGLNLALARENLAKSICIMKPAILSHKRFDLVVIPKHDNPPLKKNIAVTIGALNLIDEEYLKEESAKLKLRMPNVDFGKSIGLLIGGDRKKYKLTESAIEKVILDLKKASQDLGLDILITTSRRTSKGVENLVKKECGDFARCKLLVVASRNNIPEAVGGILGLANFVVVSGESISMVSEAASSGKYVIVFKSKNSKKHNQFLNYLAERKYIYLSEPDGIYLTLSKLSKEHPAINILDNRTVVREALRKIV